MTSHDPLALLEQIELTPGTLHVTQEMELYAPVPVGMALLCEARVAARSTRAGASFVTFELALKSPSDTIVMVGKATLLVPDKS